MNKRIFHKIWNYLIAGVWFVNGFFCKLLNLVPRHEQIVGRILGTNYSFVFTKLIGIAEVFMAIWIVVGFQQRINAVTQILIIAIMNTLEFILVPDLLLWGKLNSFFALIFILVIYFNEFLLNKKAAQFT